MDCSLQGNACFGYVSSDSGPVTFRDEFDCHGLDAIFPADRATSIPAFFNACVIPGHWSRDGWCTTPLQLRPFRHMAICTTNARAFDALTTKLRAAVIFVCWNRGFET